MNLNALRFNILAKNDPKFRAFVLAKIKEANKKEEKEEEKEEEPSSEEELESPELSEEEGEYGFTTKTKETRHTF